MTTQCGQRTRDAVAPLTYTPSPDEPHTAVPAPSRRRSTRPVGLPKPKAVREIGKCRKSNDRRDARAESSLQGYTKEGPRTLSNAVR